MTTSSAVGRHRNPNLSILRAASPLLRRTGTAIGSGAGSDTGERGALVFGDGPKIDDEETAADAALERARAMAAGGQARAGLANVKQAVRLYRQLAEKEPHVYQPDLAFALQAQSDIARAADRPGDAMNAAREAVALFRAMMAEGGGGFGLADDTEDDRALFGPYLGAALATLAARLHESGADDEALATVREGIHLFDNAAAEDLRRHRTVLDAARLLRNELSPDEHRLDEEFGALHDQT